MTTTDSWTPEHGVAEAEQPDEPRKTRGICFSRSEWEEVKAAAERRGLAAAEFVRAACLDAARDPASTRRTTGRPLVMTLSNIFANPPRPETASLGPVSLMPIYRERADRIGHLESPGTFQVADRCRAIESGMCLPTPAHTELAE